VEPPTGDEARRLAEADGRRIGDPDPAGEAEVDQHRAAVPLPNQNVPRLDVEVKQPVPVGEA